tara:strand:+ start:385 stop:861 length:477 start_codon:yes stop_codon:yes gene_type:complete
MNNSESLQLKKMINENNVNDYTNDIRDKKHSDLIRNDVTKMIELKRKYFRLAQGNPTMFNNILTRNIGFLFKNYTDIFNKVKKDEINLETLWDLLNILKQIEDGKIDQHLASFQVGKLLKKIYIDGVILRENKNSKNQKIKKKPVKNKKLSWEEYKNL